MKSPLTIYLFRHGEIAHSEERRLIGGQDVPLAANGVRQAEWWGERLRSVQFERILCSDLSRTADTASIVCRSTGVPIEREPKLREINLGRWEGLTVAEVRARFPEEWEARGRDFDGYAPLGGESFRDLDARVWPVIEEICQRPEQRVIVVGHAAVNRVILCHALGLPLASLLRLGQDYCGLNIIEHTAQGWNVRLLNRTPEGW